MMKKQLETTIRWLGHVRYLIPCIYYFLSQLRSLLSQAGKQQLIKINNKCVSDLVLMQAVLDKAKNGVDMNLLAFRSPNRIYYLDSCSAGLGGYSNQGQAWQFRVPEEYLFRALNNLLKFLAAIITPLINVIEGRLNAGDCTLSMMDSTMAEGWMQKSNFVEPDDDPVQATA
jgi:hypothetical protein